MEEDPYYGRRWIVEIHFSDLKRVMGEVIKTRRTDYMIKEVGLKVPYYNMIRENTRTYGQLCNTVYIHHLK